MTNRFASNYILCYGLTLKEGEHEEKVFESRREAMAYLKKNVFSGVCWWLFRTYEVASGVRN
jgi:hypothetical protein